MTTTPTVQYYDLVGAAWTTLTHVRSYSYTSGRRDEITGASAGQATFVFDNADSTIVGVGVNLLPKMTPIRVMVNGNTQPRWSGWVDGSPVTFPSPEGTSSFVTVTAHDSLALMQRHVCQTSIYEQTLATVLSLSSGAVGYWPLSDPAGSMTAFEASGTGLYSDAAFAGTSAAFGDSAAALPGQDSVVDIFSTGTPGIAAITGSATIAGGISVGCWMKLKSLQPATGISVRFGGGSSGQLTIWNDGSDIKLTVGDDNGHSATVSSSALGSLQWYFATASVTAAGAYSIQVNDAGTISGTVAGWSLTSPALGNVQIGNAPSIVGGFSFPMAHAWVAPGIYAGGIYASGANPLGSLTSTQLLTNLISWTGPISPYGSSIDAQNNGTTTPAAGITVGNNDCLTLSQIAVDSEDGPLFCARNGSITNLTHDTLTDRATGAATAAFVNGDVEADLTFGRDAQYLVTNCQVTALSGSGGVQSSTRNRAKFGNYPFQKSLYVTDYQALDYANWKTALYGDIDYSRIGQFTIDLLNSVDIQAAALAIDIGSRVTFSGLPSQGGYTTADVIVQGFTEDWTIDGWRISFNTTPSASYQSWILEDATYGLLDTTTVLGY